MDAVDRVADGRLDRSRLQMAFSLLPVTWIPIELYARLEEEAPRRIGERDPKDWPTVALALAFALSVWTQDKDFQSTGLTVYSTGHLLDALSSLDAP